ncbi:MAG TPA: transporter substrate-binding domain-containing protein [Actinomycetes bacterium]
MELTAPGPTWARRSAITALAALALAGCTDGSDTPTAAAAADEMLSRVEARGTLVLSTDLDYAPQSYAVHGAGRASGSRCAVDQLTGSEVSGFDAATGKAVAKALGVEPCFVSPSWVDITAGGWDGRWDLSFGSGAIEADRLAKLHVTQPYYALPAHLYVPESSTVRTPEDLTGARVGACASCSHESYLRGRLNVPGFSGIYRVVDAKVVTYAVEAPGLAATERGELDAFLCSEQVGDRAVHDGARLRRIDGPLFVELATGWVDRGSDLDVTSFVRRVDAAVVDLHRRGVLARMSRHWFGRDYTPAAADFDMSSLTQEDR